MSVGVSEKWGIPPKNCNFNRNMMDDYWMLDDFGLHVQINPCEHVLLAGFQKQACILLKAAPKRMNMREMTPDIIATFERCCFVVFAWEAFTTPLSQSQMRCRSFWMGSVILAGGF